MNHLLVRTARKANVNVYDIDGKTGTGDWVINGRCTKDCMLIVFTAIVLADYSAGLSSTGAL